METGVESDKILLLVHRSCRSSSISAISPTELSQVLVTPGLSPLPTTPHISIPTKTTSLKNGHPI